MATCKLSPSESESRKDVATPRYEPFPDREGLLRTENVIVTLSGFHRGEEEMELDCISSGKQEQHGTLTIA